MAVTSAVPSETKRVPRCAASWVGAFPHRPCHVPHNTMSTPAADPSAPLRKSRQNICNPAASPPHLAHEEDVLGGSRQRAQVGQDEDVQVPQHLGHGGELAARNFQGLLRGQSRLLRLPHGTPSAPLSGRSLGEGARRDCGTKQLPHSNECSLLNLLQHLQRDRALRGGEGVLSLNPYSRHTLNHRLLGAATMTKELCLIQDCWITLH